MRLPWPFRRRLDYRTIRERLSTLCDYEGIGTEDAVPVRIMLEAGMTPADIAEMRRDELDIDLSPKFVAATDRVLMRLWLHGFVVLPHEDDEKEAA